MGSDTEIENDFGDDFAYGAGTIYLNNASVSLMPKSSIAAMADFVTEYNALGPDSDRGSELAKGKMQNVRRLVSEIISCQPDELVLTQSTTDGVNMTALGLGTLKAGSNVVIRGMEHEHHANLYPWLRLGEKNGVQVRNLPIDEYGFFDMRRLESLVDARTGLVVLSHALYNTGSILPVGEAGRVMRSHDARFFVDAAQTVGCMRNADCDVSAIQCDYMSFNGSKWLCGPMGTGLFYCSREAGRHLEPVAIGGESAMLQPTDATTTATTTTAADASCCDDTRDTDSATPRRLAFKDAPAKFQTGFRNYAGVAGLEASLEYLREIGSEKIRSRNRNLSGLLQDELGRLGGGITTYMPADPKDRTSIISFNVQGQDPRHVVRQLGRQGIILAVRGLSGLEMVRAAPHFFNTENQIHRLVDALKALL